MGKLTDPVHAFEDADRDEVIELKQKLKDTDIRIQESKYRFLKDGYITLDDCKKVAEKISERDNTYYSADDVLDKWFRDDGISLEDFIFEDEKKEV